ncbi:protein of unknown function [Cupriavidus taiwanensis]|nr:protein of unknown function [Cupriavidus taiwanensis]
MLTVGLAAGTVGASLQRQECRRAAFACGFNRSMQHTKGFASLRGAANEAKTADLLHRDPKGTDVGTVAQR